MTCNNTEDADAGKPRPGPHKPRRPHTATCWRRPSPHGRGLLVALRPSSGCRRQRPPSATPRVCRLRCRQALPPCLGGGPSRGGPPTCGGPATPHDPLPETFPRSAAGLRTSATITRSTNPAPVLLPEDLEGLSYQGPERPPTVRPSGVQEVAIQCEVASSVPTHCARMAPPGPAPAFVGVDLQLPRRPRIGKTLHGAL